VNTNALARLYDALTPSERLPAIMAASLRGDDVEADRLARSAPVRIFRVPDYFGLAEGLKLLAVFVLAELLELTTLHWQLVASRDSHEGDAHRALVRDTSRALAYRFVAKLDAIRQLSAGGLDVAALLDELPGMETVLHAEPTIRELLDGGEPTDAANVAAEITSMRAFVVHVAESWV
jgi:hypothetical protein